MTGVTTINDETCRLLLRAGTFGRMAVITPVGPEIVPVNYRVVDDTVTVRTASGTVLARYAADARVCFEIDLVDYERWVGWSVVARGPARVEQVSPTDVVVSGPRPWATTEGDVLVTLAWTSVSGRKIGAGWDALLAMPARTTTS